MSTKEEMRDCLGDMLEVLSRYAGLHRELYGSPIGEDGVLGDHWHSMARGLIGLLNGETGDTDCGGFDHDIRAMAVEEGFSQEEVDQL